ncbi:zinc metallopeptidase [Luteolibacter arcticus]|uniref:Zinc metallopeptidase n=1 Tax=Luteolibacter arcticus TaxID=1581411 RepID=A0ABT3GMH6_9BACT|nr:zinc metallopeptidase [Luteolibacter arcticus]MCW1924721.1 zinc metallopeptidase [Luteolibacter arcticus]
MWKVVLILSLIPLVGACLARHWFWTKARMEGLRQDCGTSVRELRERLGLPPGRRGNETHAAALGNALRECGLALLEKEGNTFAKARVSGSFLTKALPALVLLVAVFAILSKRVPAGWAIAGAVGTVAFWTLVRLSGMAVEWRAVAKGTEALKASRALKRVADEDEVIRCAKASVWSTVWPF